MASASSTSTEAVKFSTSTHDTEDNLEHHPFACDSTDGDNRLARREDATNKSQRRSVNISIAVVALFSTSSNTNYLRFH